MAKTRSGKRTKGALTASRGYRSASPEFRKIVNIKLSRSGRFERVGRGRYAAK